jgi:hypothetical protein
LRQQDDTDTVGGRIHPVDIGRQSRDVTHLSLPIQKHVPLARYIAANPHGILPVISALTLALGNHPNLLSGITCHEIFCRHR